MREVEINKQLYLVPSKWQECTIEQIVAILPLSLLSTDTSTVYQKIKLKRKILSVIFPAANNALFKQLSEQQCKVLLKLTDWIFTDKITQKPFRYFEIAGVKYYLPDENFGNTTAVEVALANIHFFQYANPDKPQAMAAIEIMAILCRPRRKDLAKFKESSEWNGDIREEYNSELAKERVKLFGKLPAGYVLAVIQYFAQMNCSFLDRYKDTYNDDQDERPMYPDGRGILTALWDIAKLNVFGNADSVYKQNAHTVWMFMQDHSIKIKRQIEEQEKLYDTD